MRSIEAVFENGTVMYAFIATEAEEVEALGDMADEMGEDPVEIRTDGGPYQPWPQHPYQSVTIADMISDANVMVL